MDKINNRNLKDANGIGKQSSTRSRNDSSDSFTSASSLISSIGTDAEDELLNEHNNDRLTTTNQVLSRQEKNKKQSKPRATKTKVSNADENNQILSMLSEIKTNQVTKQDLSQMVNSIDGKFESIHEDLAAYNDRVDSLELKVKQFETKIIDANYDSELHKQQLLKNNISIFGFPRTEDENITELVLLIFKSFGCEFSKSDITSAYRSDSKTSKFSTIIVKFVSFEKKLAILNVKAKKPVQLGDVIQCSPQQQKIQIYLNNHVTPFFGRLLAAGRQASKDKLIHSCWIGTTGCMVKLKEDGKPINVRTLGELELIKSKSGTAVNNKRQKPDDPSSPNESNPQKKTNVEDQLMQQ